MMILLLRKLCDGLYKGETETDKWKLEVQGALHKYSLGSRPLMFVLLVIVVYMLEASVHSRPPRLNMHTKLYRLF